MSGVPGKAMDALTTKLVASSVAKAHRKKGTAFLLAVLAGVYIGFGGAYATVVTSEGGSKVVGGLVFTLGLELVLVAGSELFTGNVLMVVALARGRISLSRMLASWGVVLAGNVVGGVMVAVLFVGAGSDALSATLSIGLAKPESAVA